MTCTLAELWNKFYFYHCFTAYFYFCWFPLQVWLLFDLSILCSHNEIYRVKPYFFFLIKRTWQLSVTIFLFYMYKRQLTPGIWSCVLFCFFLSKFSKSFFKTSQVKPPVKNMRKKVQFKLTLCIPDFLDFQYHQIYRLIITLFLYSEILI